MAKIIGFKILLTSQEREELGSNVWISEYLRYAGCVNRPELDIIEIDGKLSREHVLKVNCDFKGCDTKIMVKQNIGRLASFGRKAVEWRV